MGLALDILGVQLRVCGLGFGLTIMGSGFGIGRGDEGVGRPFPPRRPVQHLDQFVWVEF